MRWWFRCSCAGLLAALLVANAQAQTSVDDTLGSPQTAARFLTQTTFGPTPAAIADLTGGSSSAWFRNQLAAPPSLLSPRIEDLRLTYDDFDEEDFNPIALNGPIIGFWENSITGEDQLRQRMAFALSQILVVSNAGSDILGDLPEGIAYYQDILIDGAFGNYRDLLQRITYAPAMGVYLTYLGSAKADPETGRMPDENYARELLQLFTVGVVALNPDGTTQRDASGNAIELYNNDDITGLARVFTGFRLNRDAVDVEEVDDPDLRVAATLPMVIDPRRHSAREKTFLGTTLPANLSGDASVTAALDAIFAHPNVGPFIGRQLIQRFVTSNPTAGYTARVAEAFDAGIFQLPDGDVVGEGRRGDLRATLAAVIFDPEARASVWSPHGKQLKPMPWLSQFETAKVREPVLRFTHWARAFDAVVTPEFNWDVWNVSGPDALSQQPYGSPSVFNFFRPGYALPGSLSSQLGLVAPELQLANASAIPGYANYLAYFAFNWRLDADVEEVAERFAEEGVPIDAEDYIESFTAPYTRELALADNAAALIDHLDATLTYGMLTADSRQLIHDALNGLAGAEPETRVATAVMMVMTSPDYLLQR